MKTLKQKLSNMVNKKNKFCLVFSFFLIGILFFNSAFAQQTLPIGGSSFETAIQLGAGKYQGGALQEDQKLYYSLQGKAGQQLKIKAKFLSEDNFTVALYNENQEELDSGFGNNLELNWLSNADKSSHKYYLGIISEGWTADSFSLEIFLTNKYDANSTTDAGDSFDKALNITPGSYSGYLSGNACITCQLGDDLKDVYKIGLKKGITYEFKLIPPSETELILGLYDSNRQSLQEESSANKGAIVFLSLTPSADTNIFVSVLNYAYPYQDAIINYQLEVKSSVPLTKFYVCKDKNCELTGEYPSLADCQKATTKTCYQTENCDEKCATVSPPPPAQCTKDSDCSTGNVCKDAQCQLPTPIVGCIKDSDCSTGNVCKDGQCGAVLSETLLSPGQEPLTQPNANPFFKLLAGLKNLNWLYIGIIAGMVVLVIIVLTLLLRKKPAKKENIPTATFSGSKEADKPTVGYKHPCKYCDKLIPPNSTVCPLCGKLNPLGPYRCPKCHEPVQKDWQACSRCGQNLRIVCPKCGKVTFFGDYCEDCGARLLVACSHCNQEQPPISDKCIKCNRPFKNN